jgi:hypothetical protein
MSCASSVASTLSVSTCSDPPLEGQEETINGTSFDMEAKVLPHVFATRRKKNYNRVVRTVVRIVVVKINVRPRARTPEGMTFDIVGNCAGDQCHLNPSFVLRHETSPRRVKAMAIEFDLRPEDMDSFEIDIDEATSTSHSLADPVNQKRRFKAPTKKFPPFLGKRPRHAPPLSDEESEEGPDEPREGRGEGRDDPTSSTPGSPLSQN